MTAIQIPRPDRAALAAASQRTRLADGGWRPVAVFNCDARCNTPGKQPKGDQWQLRARRDPPEAATARPELDALNTGLLCDGMRAIDIDIDDRDLAATVRAQAVAAFGETIIRSRNNTGRCLLVYRAAEGSPPKRVLNGRLGKIEVLGHGQQFVAFGMHPSGAPLQWFPAGPDTTPAAAVPAVPEPAVDAFLAAVATVIGAEPKAAKGNADATHMPSAFGPAADGLDVAGALASIPNNGPSDWEHWNRVGLATYAATGGSMAGFAAWCAWSERHPSHDPSQCRERWQHFATSPPGNIGAGTLFHLAQESRPGWTKPTANAAAPDRDMLTTPDMTVLRLNRRAPPPLPLQVFGDRWAAWITGTAEAAACPSDYVAGPLLAAASCLIGNARWAEAWPGWQEPPHLWTCSVGDSGGGKSPGADTLLRDVLPAVERRMGTDHPAQRREWQAACEAAKAAQEAWQGEVRTAQKSGHAPPLPPETTAPPEPQAPRVRVNDVTVERVATLLASAAPKGLLIHRDELLGWVAGIDAYNDAGRAFWIEAYGGRPYRVERQKHPDPIDVPRLAVAACGGTQPAKLATLLQDADDGLLSRVTWFWPDPVPFAMGSAGAGASWATEALDRLRLLDLAPGDGPDMPSRPVVVPLAETARPDMVAFGRDMQVQQEAAGGLLRSALAKARGLALRLALVLEYLWWAGKAGMTAPPARIGREAFAAAAHLVADYLIPMAERVYGDAATRTEDRNAATLARWIMRTRPSEVHVRTLQREVRLPGLGTAETIHAAAAALVEAGWLLPPAPGAQQHRGRAAYPVNPHVYGAAA